MTRMLHRMVLCGDHAKPATLRSVRIRPYRAVSDHDVIPVVYGRAFGEPPWPADWDRFDEFDANGAFVAEDPKSGELAGFVLSFPRAGFGYISVVSVVPEFHRQGMASALVATAIRYLQGLDLNPIKVDAYVDSEPAVKFYRAAGFRIESTFEDEETRT